MYDCKSRCVHNMLRCPVNSSMATSRRDLPLSRAGKPPIFGKTASTVQVVQRNVHQQNAMEGAHLYIILNYFPIKHDGFP